MLTFNGHHGSKFPVQKVKAPFKVIFLLPGKIQKRNFFVVKINRDISMLLIKCARNREIRDVSHSHVKDEMKPTMLPGWV